MPKLLFKFIGLISLLLCCTALGFLKANSLKLRLDALQKIKGGLLTLKERLRLHSGDKNRLIGGCFGDGVAESGRRHDKSSAGVG